MASEKIELLEDIYGRWSQGDFRLALSDDFTIEMGPDFPDPGEHIGPEGTAAYMRNFLEPWERLTIEAQEVFEGEDEVLVRVLQVGTGRSSGITVELRYFQLWTFEDERPIRMETIMKEPDAMARVRQS